MSRPFSPTLRLASGAERKVKVAKNDGCLPMGDHNRRIIVFGRDGAQAQAAAEAIAQEAFYNVAYFGGTFETLIPQVAGK